MSAAATCGKKGWDMAADIPVTPIGNRSTQERMLASKLSRPRNVGLRISASTSRIAGRLRSTKQCCRVPLKLFCRLTTLPLRLLNKVGLVLLNPKFVTAHTLLFSFGKPARRFPAAAPFRSVRPPELCRDNAFSPLPRDANRGLPGRRRSRGEELLRYQADSRRVLPHFGDESVALSSLFPRPQGGGSRNYAA